MINTIAKVNDIRPLYSISGEAFQNAFDSDLKWMRDREKFFVDVDCPACDGDTIKYTIDTSPYPYIRCSNCQTLYQKARLPEYMLGEFYAQSAVMEHYQKVIFPASKQNRIDKIYTPRINRVLDVCQKLNSACDCFVEVGAGSGTFLFELKKRNIFSRLIAIEPGKSLANDCREMGLETFEMPVEAMHPVHADVIASFEVLEHLFSPADFLENINKFISKSGICIFTTPNSLSLEVLELGKYSTTLGTTHINIFTPQAIELLAKKTGFEVEDIFTPGILDVDLIREAYNSIYPVNRSPFWEYILNGAPSLQAECQNFLVNNKLSSHMWIVLRKK